MNHSNLKFLFCVAVSLAMLLAPFALDLTPGGEAQAGIFGKNKKPDFVIGNKSGGKKPKTSWADYKPQTPEQQGHSHTTHQVPEPATMLLVGGGLASLALFRRKFKR